MSMESGSACAGGSMTRKLLRMVAALGLLAALLPTAPATALAADPVVLRIGVRQAATPQAFNPMRGGAMSTLDWYLLHDVFDVQAIPDDMALAPAPGIVASWDTSADGLTWTYHVSPDATWHDGKPITAGDFVFTYDYIRNSLDPAYKGPAAPEGNDKDANGEADFPLYGNEGLLDILDGAENSRLKSVTAVDDKTVQIVTSAPMALPLRYLTVLPEQVYGTITYAKVAEYENYDAATGTVGSGPFIVKEFKPTEFVRLTANDGYWKGKPKVDELIYQYFSNDEALVQALKAGQIDMITDVPPSLWATLQGDPNIKAIESAGTNFQEVGFNSWDPTAERFADEGCADCPKGPTTGSMGNPWLTKPEVRTAMSGLIDKQLLVERALAGHGEPGVSLISPLVSDLYWEAPAGDPASFPAYTDEAGRAAARQQAIDRFKTAMAALGFADTDGDGILNAPATPEATAFDPVRTQAFSDSGDTKVGAGLNFKLRLIVRDDAQEDKVAAELIEAWYEEAGVDIDRQLVKEDPQLYDATYPSATNQDVDLYIWRWDPVLPIVTFPFNVVTCAEINGASDSAYCNPAYDAVYKRFLKATTPEERSSAAREMQSIIYSGGPYAVLWYLSERSAYRADKWEGFLQWPNGTGEIWEGGPYGSRLTVAPLGSTPTPAPSPTGEAPSGATPAPAATPAATPAPVPASDSGSSTGLLVGGLVGLVAVVGVALYLVKRRRSDDDD